MSDGLWQSIDACPLCGSREGRNVGYLPGKGTAFAGYFVHYPEKISLNSCGSCGLLYKSVIPTQSLITKLYENSGNKLWSKWYSYESEMSFIEEYLAINGNGVLDIGAGRGDTLRALQGKARRMSAMDVIKQSGIDEVITGEFFYGCVDADDFEFHDEPYQMVTAFDVIEHFSSANVAFSNIASMLERGGVFFAETGDADSYWPHKYGAHNWWYVNLLEHTIFWSKECVQNLAEIYGFTVEKVTEKKHKRRSQDTIARIVRDTMKVAMYMAFPKKYVNYALRNAAISIQPSSPFAKDHLLFVLKKK